MKYYNVEVIPEGDVVVCAMPDCNGKFIMIKCVVGGEWAYIADVVYKEAVNVDELDAKLRVWKPMFTLFECHKSYFPIVRNIREWLDDVRAMGEYANRDARISANEEFLKRRLKFRGDYEALPEYAEFMESVMDYNGKDNYEAVNCLSALCAYLGRNYFAKD